MFLNSKGARGVETLESIEFNFNFHPIPIENFEIAKNVFNKFNQGIKQIEYKNDKVIFTTNLLFHKSKAKTLKKIEIYKGIYLYVYNNKQKSKKL